MKVLNYEVYEIGSTIKDKGKASLVDLERLLPIHLLNVVLIESENQAKIFKLEMISGNAFYKIWK